MAKAAVPGFQRLGDDISLWRPERITTTTAKGASPSLIVYCSWMGAAPKHIAKYTEAYKRHYSNADILLIECRAETLMKGLDVTPAYDALRAYSKKRDDGRPDATASSGVILHMSSNGGATNSALLAQNMQHAGLKLQFDAVIFDCSPGKIDLSSGTRAMTMQLPNKPLIRLIGSWLIYTCLVLYMTLSKIFRIPDGITRVRRNLSDPSLFAQESPRLYLYSKADSLINAGHVREHAEEAKALGYSVREEVFEKALHCALVMEDSERYWNAIHDVVLRGGAS